MKSAAIAVAPAAMSPGSLSKSNSTSPPIVWRAGAVAVLAPEVTIAWQVPVARLPPSTEIVERSERTSHRTLTVAFADGGGIDWQGSGVQVAAPALAPPSTAHSAGVRSSHSAPPLFARQHWMSSFAGGVTGSQGFGSHEVASTTMPPSAAHASAVRSSHSGPASWGIQQTRSASTGGGPPPPRVGRAAGPAPTRPPPPPPPSPAP